MSDFFQFETDFVDSLRCIPMLVRYRLDTCGVKLKLAQWNQFDLAARNQLVEMNTDTLEATNYYRTQLIALIYEYSGEEATLLSIESQSWLNGQEIPAMLLVKARELNCDLSVEQWHRLTTLQRFALIKLTKSSHEQNNFLPALKEFKLL
jgi:hypothetical protein